MTTDRPPIDVEAKLFRGLADPSRLRLLTLLRDGPRPAGELASAAGLSASGASNHLGCLLECGLVQVEMIGRYNVYRISDASVSRLLEAGDALLGEIGEFIEACHEYGPPPRRRLASREAVPTGVIPPAVGAMVRNDASGRPIHSWRSRGSSPRSPDPVG